MPKHPKTRPVKKRAAKEPRPPKYQPTYLRGWREWLGLSVEALGAQMSYNSGTLNEIENGNVRYNQDVIERAARVISVPPSFIVGKPPPPKGEEVDRSDPQYITWLATQLDPVERLAISHAAQGFVDAKKKNEPR